MSLPELEHPATNPDKKTSGLWGQSKALAGDALSGMGNLLMNGATLAGTAGKGLAKYGYDTLTAERNSVPYSVRVAVGGARNAEDKLKTLRQFYPDAMPTADGDFTFIDPKTKQRVNLNDAGLSMGDALESLPDIGEAVGGTLGAIKGGALGGTAGSLVPGVGTALGAIGGGIAGAGTGAAAGNELTRQGAQALAALLTGKDEIDTRAASDIGMDALKTGGLNAGLAAIPFAGRGVRNYFVKKNLTDESAELAKFLTEKGYKPTLGQIGSDSGKELNDKLVAGKILKDELYNQDVLNKNTGEFLGDLAGLDQNALANRFRAGQKTNLKGKKATASELYENVNFGDDLTPAEGTKAFVQDLLKKRGKGKTANPDLVLDASMERKMQRVLKGKATEAELESFRSDVKTALRNKDLKYDTKQALVTLDTTLTDDLVKGSPDISEADRAARAAYFDYKKSQEKVGDILGRAEGVTDKTRIGQGATEGQSLKNARTVFSSGTAGSDAEAEALSKVLTEGEKKTVLASLLQEDQTARGFENSIEKAAQNYNLERIGKYLVNPDEKAALDDLMKQAQGTKAIPQGFRDRSDLINAEAAFTAGATAIDPSLGMGAATVGNIMRGAPGTYGGSGQLATSVVKQNAFAQKLRQMQSNAAVKAAQQGEMPSSLNYMPASPNALPGAIGGGQMALGNTADAPESNLRISTAVRDQNLPPAASLPPKKGIDLDSLLSAEEKPSFNLDDYLQGESKPAMPPAAPVPQEVRANGTEDLDKYISENYKDAKPQATMDDLDNYIKNNYGKKSGGGLMEALKRRESGGNYGAVNDIGYSGAYQMGAAALEDVGLLKKGASKAGNRAMDNPDNWTIPGGKQAFLENPQIQDAAMQEFTELNKRRMLAAGLINPNMTENQVNGYLAAAHLGGVGGAMKLAQGSPRRDAYGTSTEDYYRLGLNA